MGLEGPAGSAQTEEVASAPKDEKEERGEGQRERKVSP